LKYKSVKLLLVTQTPMRY